MGETFYDVLGVGRDASQADIESAYRERVKETHPDLNDSPDATDAFQRVQTAEEVLGDPDERARYDRLGHRSYTSHFGTSTAEDGGSGWDVGSDRTAEEARGSAGRDRGRGGAAGGGTGRGDTVGGDGFGFDPGAYDSTRERHGDGNPTERGYDVSGGDAADGGGDEAGATASATASGASGSGGATAGASAADGATGRAGASATGRERADASENWQERARRTEREWSKATQREARTSNDDDGPGGYSVHDWNDDEIGTESKRVSLKGSELVVVTITFLLYPFMVYSTVAPEFPMFVNGVVGLCALALTGYLLTMPRVGFLVFGAWSVIAPVAFLTIPALEIVSIVGLAMLGTTWIPFGYSILFLHVLD